MNFGTLNKFLCKRYKVTLFQMKLSYFQIKTQSQNPATLKINPIFGLRVMAQGQGKDTAEICMWKQEASYYTGKRTFRWTDNQTSSAFHASWRSVVGLQYNSRKMLDHTRSDCGEILIKGVTCFKMKAKPSEELMGELPSERVRPLLKVVSIMLVQYPSNGGVEGEEVH